MDKSKSLGHRSDYIKERIFRIYSLVPGVKRMTQKATLTYQNEANMDEAKIIVMLTLTEALLRKAKCAGYL